MWLACSIAINIGQQQNKDITHYNFSEFASQSLSEGFEKKVIYLDKTQERKLPHDVPVCTRAQIKRIVLNMLGSCMKQTQQYSVCAANGSLGWGSSKAINVIFNYFQNLLVLNKMKYGMMHTLLSSAPDHRAGVLALPMRTSPKQRSKCWSLRPPRS